METGPDRAATGPRGDPDRVVEVRHQARRSLTAAAAFALVAPVAAVAPWTAGSWAPLHLFLVGGLLSAISGATQLLAVTWSASPAPPRVAATTQRWVLAAGAVAVVVGWEADAEPVALAGAAAVAVALGLLGTHLLRIRSTAVTDRFRPAIEAYLVAVVAGIAGTVLAVWLVTGDAGARWWEVRSAHLTVNLYGLVGMVIAGTLPYFVATQARTKVSPRATTRRVRSVVGLLAAATTVTAAGHLAARAPVAGAGLAAYAAGLVLLATLLPAPSKRQLDWAGPRLLQLAAGLAWWVGTTALLAVAVISRSGQGPVLRAMVIGGFAQILLASLAYLGPVLRGGGHRRLSAGFALGRSWPGLVAVNLAAGAALAEQPAILTLALAVVVADTALRAVLLAVRPEEARP